MRCILIGILVRLLIISAKIVRYQVAAAARRKAEAAAAGDAPPDSAKLFGGTKLVSSASASASASAAAVNVPKWLFPPPVRPPFDANSKVSDSCFLNHSTVLMAHLDLEHAGDRLKVEWRAREKSAFACELLKQNDAGKLQMRHFLITSHAIYNFLPGMHMRRDCLFFFCLCWSCHSVVLGTWPGHSHALLSLPNHIPCPYSCRRIYKRPAAADIDRQSVEAGHLGA